MLAVRIYGYTGVGLVKADRYNSEAEMLQVCGFKADAVVGDSYVDEFGFEYEVVDM